jgi:acyl carrier protein
MDQTELIRQYLAGNFSFGIDTSQLTEDDSLLEKGIVDSAGILDLVAWVEETFRVSIDDMEITPENFDSIQRIVDFIQRKQQIAATG